MAIFDNELIDNQPSSNDKDFPKVPKHTLGSPVIKDVDVRIPRGGGININGVQGNHGGYTIDQLSEIGLAAKPKTGFDAPMTMIPRSELLANQRYGTYVRGVDLENIAALNQTWYQQLGNGIVKMGATGLGTFAQSFATIPSTVSAIKNTSLSDLSGPKGYESDIDVWLKNIEDSFPNYISRWEREHPWAGIVPFTRGSANFWGDKIIKNLGFTAGAIVGSLAQDAIVGAVTEGLGEIPLVANQIGKASLWLNKVFSGTNRLDDIMATATLLGKTEKQMLNMKNLAYAAESTKLANGFRYGLSIYGSARTEAAVEARDAYRQVRKDLIDQYRATNNGQDPVGADLDTIESYATDTMNVRFGINMALLTASNAIQFGSLFKSFTNSAKGVPGSFERSIGDLGKVGLVKGSIDEFEKKAVEGVVPKIWNAVKPTIKNIFAEGVYEEGGQYATEKGTYDYYTRKYKNLQNPANKENWNSLNEIIKSTGTGLAEEFGSTEGLQNILLGGITALLTGAVTNRIEKVRGKLSDDQKLQASINILNSHKLTGVLADQYDNTLNSAGIAKEMEEAAKSGNVFRYKNLKHDQFFTFVMSRIPSDMHDVTIEQLRMLKDLDKDQFEKTFGMNFDESSKKTVNEYVDGLIAKANSIKTTADSVNATFKNPYNNYVNPTTPEEYEEANKHRKINEWKTNLIYYPTVVQDVNERLANIQNDVTAISPLIENDTLSTLTKEQNLKELRDLYEEQAASLSKTITETTTPEDKRRIKNQVKALRTASEKIAMVVNSGDLDVKTFESLLNFELSGRTDVSTKLFPTEKAIELYEKAVSINDLKAVGEAASISFDRLASEEGLEKFFEQAKEMEKQQDIAEEEVVETPEAEVPVVAPVDFVNKEGVKETPIEGRQYSIEGIRKATVKKLDDGRYEVTSPTGETSIHSSKDRADDAAAEINEDLADLGTVNVLAINDDGTLKVEDSKGNIQNIKPELLGGYERIQTTEEKLGKNKEDVENQQNELQTNSGTVFTGDPTKETYEKEPKLKDETILFPSTITESEGSEEWPAHPEESAPHVQRARVFMNTAKNSAERPNMRSILVTGKTQDSLGLSGLLQLSYGKSADTKIEDIPNSLDVANGWVASVFVVQDGTKYYFVDQNGKRVTDEKGNPIELGQQVDINKVVFQTMPTTSLVNSKGKPRYRSNQATTVGRYQTAWTIYRTQLFEYEPGTFPVHNFVISRGIANTTKDMNHVGDILIPSNKISTQRDLIVISTTGTIAHNGQAIKFPVGRPVLQYGDTLQFLNNSQYGEKKARVIYRVIKRLTDDMVAKNKAGKTIEFDKAAASYLQNVLFWFTKKETTKNQIFIDTATMQISIGGKRFGIGDVANNEELIVDTLKNAYYNINNDTLKNRFDQKFYEFYIDSTTNELEEREWDNYQAYLLSSTYPDGKARPVSDTPLYTNVSKPTPAVPYSFVQKYATLDLKLPVAAVSPKVEAAPEKTRKYSYDGTTENTYEIPNIGVVKFTVKEGQTPEFNQEDKDFKATQSVIIDRLKKILPDASDEELVRQANGAILGYVNKELVTDVAPTTAAVLQPDVSALAQAQGTTRIEPVITAVPVSDVEAKKADIERRRQEAKAEQGLATELIETFEGVNDDGDVQQVQVRTQRNGKKSNWVKNSDGKWVRLQEYPGENESINLTKGILYDDVKKISEEKPEYKGSIDEKIDKKYDAELAALEEAKPAEEVKPAEKVNTKKFKPPSDQPYRRVGKEKAGRITSEEIQLFKDWAEKNVPNIPFEILENIITTHDGEKAWGVFEDGVAKFYRKAVRGTEYHEVFEAIWKGFLNDAERNDILTEFRAKKGEFTDRATRKQIAYADATDQEAKERIADDFADFRLGRLPAKSLGDKILRFFRAILNFFKSFVQKPSLKTQLFKDIDTGKFKEKTLAKEAITEAPEYRAAEGFTEQETRELVDDMTARAAIYLFGSAKRLLYSPLGVTSGEVFSDIERKYIAEERRQEMTDAAWNQLVQKTKDKLYTLGISVDSGDRVNINQEGYNKLGYAPEPFSIDWKKNSPFAIKFTLATLIQMKAMDQTGALSVQASEAKLSDNVTGYQLVNFSRAFATVMDKLANTTKVSSAVAKLFNLASVDADYISFARRLGGDKGLTVMQFDNFKSEDWRLFINFMQTFTKQKPNAVIEYRSGTSVHTGAANIYTAIEAQKTNWKENIKALANAKDSIIRLDRDNKVYVIDVDAINELPIKNPSDMINFLEKVGITFPMDVYLKLSTSQKNTFTRAVGSMKAYLGKDGNILSLTKEALNINGPISNLAEVYVNATNPNQESTYPGVDGERVGAFADNNAPSLFENQFNEAASLAEFKQERKELNDVFSTHSVILKTDGAFYTKEGVRKKDLKVSYIQGTRNNDTNRGYTSGKIGLAYRFTQEINQNVQGNYYVLMPGDGATPWMMNLGNHISYENVASGRGWKQFYDIFRGYLSDDVALALDWKNRKNLKNIGKKAKELRFFKDILHEGTLEKINALIADKSTTQDKVEKFIDENIKDINESVKEFVESTVQETRGILTDGRQVVQYNTDSFTYTGLTDEFAGAEKLDKHNLSNDAVNNILTFANMNYIINNIEYHKILFGDPYQFAIEKGKFDETKRIKSFLSPRRTTFDSEEYNNFLNDEYNKANAIALNSKELGYHIHKPYTETITLKNNIIAGSLANIMAAYGNTDESDAASWLMDNTYREIKLKNAQWPDEAEAFHQWQMAWTRQNMPGYEYKTKGLAEQDAKLIEKPCPKFTLEILKPIVSGNKYDKNTIDLVLDKFSQMPIYYSMVKGTNLENLYIQMQKQGIGYAIVESGRKVGVEGSHSLYNSDGSFNKNPFAENTKVKVSWKSYGIQVENSYDGGAGQTRGSQLTKLASVDLFSDGKATSPEAEKQYKRNTAALVALNRNGYNQLLKRLGITDTGSGFAMMDGRAISDLLALEMMRREMSDNAKETIQLDENDQFRIPFEASPAYVQVRNIMYSMIDKAIGSPTMNGGSYVQAPVTGFEKLDSNRGLAIKTKDGWKKISQEEYVKLGKDDQANVILTDDTLKFYTKENPYCEVMLPHFLKVKLGKGKFKTDEDLLNYLNSSKEGQSILRAIGFRIPTQALSSAEAIKIKGFLPEYMGKTVIVPSEITTKAGSDFDIDKLNMYLKNTYIDDRGDIRLVELRGNEETTKAFYAQVFDKKLAGKTIKKAELFEALDILSLGLDDPKNLVDRYADILNSMFEESDAPQDVADKLMKELETLGDQNLQEGLKDLFVDEMYHGALENEYYDSLEKLITLPENFDRLISPVDDAGLGKVADEINTLTKAKVDPKNKIIDRNFMTTKRHNFLLGKEWIGMIATNITNNSQMQKTPTFIDPAKFDKVPLQDQKFLGNGKIILPHNTITVNGGDVISMSAARTADGKNTLISKRLSGYATGAVDVVKDDRLVDIVKSTLAINTFMFLERVGAGETIPFFMNQPIIQEYLKMLDALDTKNLFNRANIEVIRERFVTTDSLLESTTIDTSLDNLKSNISEYADNQKLNETKNAEQQKILTEFLKYAKMAEYSFKFTQATNYDTTKFRSAASLYRKQVRTERAIEKNIISSANNVLNATFVGDQAKLYGLYAQAMGDTVFILDQDRFRAILENDVLSQYADNDYLSQDNYEKIADKANAAFIDYIIGTKSDVGKEVYNLLINPETSVAGRIEKAKEKYPSIQILKELVPTSSDRVNGAKSIKLAANDRTPISDDIYTGMMRELRDTNTELNQLYKDIVKVAILQGVYTSPISIRNIIPIEDYAAIAAPIFRTLVADETLDAFSEGFFERNNFSDPLLMPKVTPKFFLASDTPVYMQVNSAGMYYADIYQYYSSLFPNIERFKIKSTDRKILLLNEKYNSFDIKNKYVTVPRVVTDKQTGDSIDMKTGLTITKMDYALRMKKGDLSLFDTYGYKKVMGEDGLPLTYVNKDGDVIHVYKMVNLYGDRYWAKENYQFFTPSVIENGTVGIDNEIPDGDIITYFQDKYGTTATNQVVTEEESKKISTPEEVTPPVTSVSISMQPFNVEKIKAGTKTTTTRSQREFENIGLPVGQSATVKFGGQDFTVTNRGLLSIQEAGGKEVMLKSEGYASVNDLLYQQTKDWMNGKGKLYVYDIAPQQQVGIKPVTREYTPEIITSLKPNEVFVFGSNTEGRHGLGAAETAKKKFGAIQGQAEGLQGQSYAIITKDLAKGERSIPLYGMDGNSIAEKVRDFVEFANSHPQLKFYVTKLGSKLAGYSIEEIKNIFDSVNTLYLSQDIKNYIPNNVILPKEYEVRTVENQPVTDMGRQFEIEPGYGLTDANFEVFEGYDEAVAAGDKKSIFESRTNPLNYTTDQTNSLLDVQKLIDDNKQAYYLLAGYAGTGKTTIAENIAKYAMANGRPVLIMAPTNKAAKVLNDKLAAAGVNAQASTIHRAVYGEPDPETGEWIPKADIKNAVVIVDESSMIAKDVMGDLLNATANNNVVVFMGDSFQLEPVGEDSGLFTGKVSEVKGKSELKEVKRQSLDSNVLKVATLTRIDNKAYVPTVSMENFKIASGRQEFINDYKAAIKNNENMAMIVATNKERMLMNTIARNEKFGPDKKVLENGETIISVANSIDFPNSEVFKINNVQDLEKHSLTFDFKDKKVTYEMYLTYFTDENNKQHLFMHFPTLDRPSLYHAQIVKAMRESAPALFDRLDGLGYIIRTKRGIKLSPAAVIGTYGYSITAHKSQGSQWQKVFVNQDFVGSGWNGARWYYTAITRSAQDVEVLPTANNTRISPADINKKLTEQTAPEGDATDVKKKALFTVDKAVEQKTFRGIPLNFVATIATAKTTPVGMQNRGGIIFINEVAMRDKFNQKAWTNPVTQLDGSKATALAADEFKSFEEFFTFALIHEAKHNIIKKEENETTGAYEDRINKAALEDLRKNYNVSGEDDIITC